MVTATNLKLQGIAKDAKGMNIYIAQSGLLLRQNRLMILKKTLFLLNNYPGLRSQSNPMRLINSIRPLKKLSVFF